MLRVVDRVLGICVCGVAPCCVAIFAFSLASFRSSFPSLAGSHRIVTVFPFVRNALMAS